ncbi:hypothetical protein KFE25_011930 [Diacronema lutheri]|uniref:Uncharacterized protein n=1 Tax=Diacronema lutheri TaxID=2081491 RepID=A0A8J5WZY3_DIALT|nr:hypothetical protein KFE25_011930 [Diacronema lutheri]
MTGRGLAAFAPQRVDLPSMRPVVSTVDGADMSESDEPVWGRATLKKISKEIVAQQHSGGAAATGARAPTSLRSSASGGDGLVPASLGAAHNGAWHAHALAHAAERRGAGAGGTGAMLAGTAASAALGAAARSGARLLNLTQEQITRQTWGTILQQQRPGALGGGTAGVCPARTLSGSRALELVRRTLPAARLSCALLSGLAEQPSGEAPATPDLASRGFERAASSQCLAGGQR